jgi:hypothetical protein
MLKSFDLPQILTIIFVDIHSSLVLFRRQHYGTRLSFYSIQLLLHLLENQLLFLQTLYFLFVANYLQKRVKAFLNSFEGHILKSLIHE